MTNAAQTGGKIFLVGLGPGDVEHMTARARQAIAESDTVIGYSTYIKLVKDLLDGKEVIRKGMTEELDRCYEALARARQGKTVALVSSGDSGVYGMAGPTYEVLFASDWKPGNDIAVEVVPGSSAINACAALVGAPLTHDACTISLSDLLTPWPIIAGRLDAAGRSDFVIALYNPKSGRRTGQIVEAQRILLCHRSADTPVALIKSGYRRRQAIQLTTLDQMADCDIGMLTTVIIGNSNTFVRDGVMVTPRGYANKYNGKDTRDGEQAGRSLSMGLTGWHDYVRDFARKDVLQTPEHLASHFNMPVADVLAAFNDADSIPFRAQKLAAGSHEALLDFLLSHEYFQVSLCCAGGITAHHSLHHTNAQISADGLLTLVSGEVTIQLPWRNVEQMWAVIKQRRLHSLYWVNRLGEKMVRFDIPAAAALTNDALNSRFNWDQPATLTPNTTGNNNDE
ncbi:MAG: precorrin-3B C(17)-methyltransferase [Aestuariibacter sp.]|nr:precorrin-3B C(17)-methyltransferase [Aestuariibacter sp.]MCP5017444.1 precorrin-3B C(17)-methyltransferase [Ketobacter sp.]